MTRHTIRVKGHQLEEGKTSTKVKVRNVEMGSKVTSWRWEASDTTAHHQMKATRHHLVRTLHHKPQLEGNGLALDWEVGGRGEEGIMLLLVCLLTDVGTYLQASHVHALTCGLH